MKKLTFSKVRIIILCVLIALAFGLVFPVHKRINYYAQTAAGRLKDQLENQIGISVSYDSLSPSILSSIYIKGISVKNTDKEALVFINKTKINFNIFKLFSGNFQKGISSVVIDGIDVDVDELINVINYITSRQKANSAFTLNLKNLKNLIPENIRLKNINVDYEIEQLHANVNLKDIKIDNREKRNALNFDVNSSALVEIKSQTDKIRGNLLLSGNIFDELDNSTILAKIVDLSYGNYKFNKLSFLLTYLNNNFELQTVQNIVPLYIGGNFDTQTRKADARIQMEDFSVLSMISGNAGRNELKKLKNLFFNTDSRISADLNDKTFDYSSYGNISVPDELFTEGMKVDYNITGDEQEVSINQLNLEGNRISAGCQLSLIYKTLQASGAIDIPFITLPNNNQVSTELYFDSLDKGFMLFSPQIFIGNKALTALQLTFLPQNDSYDFALEVYDYSHIELGDPGCLKIDGSYLKKSNYLQTSLGITSLVAGSVTEMVCEALPQKLQNSLGGVSGFLNDFVFSGDAYFSSDFKTFSFNVPYILFANSSGKNQLLMVSANGNNETIQLNQLNLILGKYALDASALVDFNKDTNDIFYVLDFNSSSIPYHFTGTVIDNLVTLAGDYSTNGQVKIGKDNNISGHLGCENLPFNFAAGASPLTLAFSLDSDFAYDKDNGPDLQLNRFEVEEVSSKNSVPAKINATGNINKYGAQIKNISYTDFYSSLTGQADAMVNINNGIFDSVGLVMNLKNPLSDEAINLDASVTNPAGQALSGEAITKDLYLNAQLGLNKISLNRLTAASNASNLITASVSASGTIEHPFVSLMIDNASLLFGSYFLNITGGATLEDRNLAVQDFKVSYAGVDISQLSVNADLNTMLADASCSIDAGAEGMNIHIPLNINLSDSVMGKKGLESCVLKVSCPELSGALAKKKLGFELTAFYADKTINFMSSDNLGITGSYTLGSTLQALIDNHKSMYANVYMDFDSKNSIIAFNDLNVDLASVFSNLDMDDIFIINKGIATGDFVISGNLDDPDFTGIIYIDEPNVSVPAVFSQPLTTKQMEVRGVSNEIQVIENIYKLKNVNKLQADCSFAFNKGAMNEMTAHVKTLENQSVPLNIKTPVINISGNFNTSLEYILSLDEKSQTVNGTIYGDKVDVYSSLTNIATSQNLSAQGEPFGFICNLDMRLGTHASLTFDPLLRCVFVPDTKAVLKIDSDAGIYLVDGELKLRSGDIAYLNRNFYIKSGSIKFNPQEISNPQITFRAETREKDDKGQNVTLVLNAENQYLSDLNPKITTNPPKSELEVQTLLGNIVTADADSASTFLVSAGDYAVESLLFRQTENKLRDLLNFDIFSVRTNVFQNSLNVSLNNTGEKLTFSNLLDNSTVYIGKYLGSSLYFDAMLQADFEDKANFDFTTPNGLLLPLDLGLELESPVGNIRWNLSQDMNDLIKNHQFAPQASVSLMWKFTF